MTKYTAVTTESRVNGNRFEGSRVLSPKLPIRKSESWAPEAGYQGFLHEDKPMDCVLSAWPALKP